MDTKNEKQNDVPKVKKSFLFKWSSLHFSQSGAWILLGYLTLYATDVLGLDVGTVAIAFMLSKIFDGVTDIIVGVIVDKTDSKMGKARPYSLAMIGFWICIGLIFSTPQMGRFASVLYLFVMYTLIYSIFGTFVLCSETTYLSNVLDDHRQSITVNAFGGVVTAIGSLAFSIVLPQFIATSGEDPAKWRVMVWCITIPMAIIGSVRFFTVKEKREKTRQAVQKTKGLSVKETIGILVKNKYIMILSGLLFVSYIGSNVYTQNGMYYAKYILGDVGLNSILSVAMLPMIAAMVVVPALVKKFGMRRVIGGCIVCGIFGGVIRLLNPSSVGVSFLSSIFFNLGFPSFTIFVNTMVIDCMDYGEYKNGVRLEGTLAAVQSVANKVGTAVGIGIGGVLLRIAGYDGTLNVQSASANSMIIGLSTWIPALLCIVFAVIYHFYDLDRQLPEIRRELGNKQNLA